jgi:hypothetical protein
VRKNGTRFWANAVLDAIRDETGQLIGFAKITRDMTERRAAQGVGLASGVGHAEREIGVAAGDEFEVERRLGHRVVLA